MALTPAELDELAALLRRLAAEGGALPTTPRPIWDALAGVVPRLAVELFVREGEAILLTWRDDPQWHGWHVPGGFVGVGESLADAARRIGLRELDVALELEAVVADFAWPDHPCGAVLSLLCACRCPQAPSLSPATGGFFGALPTPMVQHHATFVDRFRRAVAQAAW